MASPPILCSILRQIVASEKRTIRADQLIGSRSRSRRRQPCAGTSAIFLLQGREADQELRLLFLGPCLTACTKISPRVLFRDCRRHRSQAIDLRASGRSAADARAGAVAEAGVAQARPLHSQDVVAENGRLSRLSKAGSLPTRCGSVQPLDAAGIGRFNSRLAFGRDKRAWFSR